MSTSRVVRAWLVSVMVAATFASVRAQSPRAAAPVDLTGYWVSLVTTEWRYRMMTPPKGDYEGIPLTAAAKKIADAWDPAKDTAAGEACRPYGAPALLHLPTRLHITWADDATLKLESDAGTQVRSFRFATPSPVRVRTWQGQSVADWQLARPATGGGPPSAFARSSSLKVVTTGLRAGYLRQNGVPYSENAVLTEFFDVVPGPGGTDWLIVTVQVEDPQSLTQPLVRSVQFRRQADAAGWEPTPCLATW